MNGSSISLSALENELYDLCYISPRKIAGRDEKTSRNYAKVAAKRHAHTAKQILDYATARGISKLKILNASGLQSGHQNFSICSFLRQRLEVEWVVFENPDNPFLQSPVMKEMLNELNINCQLSDFAKEEHLYGDGFYDVVIFTEIAEHLEHNTFLRSLSAIHDRLKEDGIVILTTPNLASIVNRIKLLLGDDDLNYWGDDSEYFAHKHYWGHISYYGVNRLRRLLVTVGLDVVKSYTFDYRVNNPGLTRITLPILSTFFPKGKGTIFLVAQRKQ
ncbi:class I SAM-dependent methyltransferase [Coleofasciculus sp.]|uniref:class I SAM-dependent methyltransferase n=1 Tax=Coleofasciculus sp. TaxID=3100458 RepID=UPI0039F807B5